MISNHLLAEETQRATDTYREVGCNHHPSCHCYPLGHKAQRDRQALVNLSFSGHEMDPLNHPPQINSGKYKIQEIRIICIPYYNS